MKSVFMFLSLGLLGMAGLIEAEEPVPGNGTNPQAVQAILAGTLTAANASWWGFNAEDATEILQSAINSGAPKVIVPYMGKPWIIRPITLTGNQEVFFEPGVVIEAKKGAFKGKGDSLFTGQRLENLTLTGYGAILRMHKEDYAGPDYEKAEWRMALDFMSCRKLTIQGLRLENSGGDGIYIGTNTEERPYCEEVMIRDVACVNHHRQGISIISAVNLTIENCYLAGTSGTAPEAGIDFEPNSPNERLANCVVRNSIFEDNAGAGILLYLSNLNASSEPVSIAIERCHIRSGRDVGIGVGAIRDEGPQGTIRFADCVVEGCGGAYLYDKSADAAKLSFVNCSWNHIPSKPSPGRPDTVLLLNVSNPDRVKRFGGIEFINCHIYDEYDRAVLTAENEETGLSMYDLTGQILVHSPFTARADYQCPVQNAPLSMQNAPQP